MQLLCPKFKRLLVFFRLIDDHDGNLSFTNLALIIVLAKIATVQEASVMDLGSLLIALTNFNVKKYINVLSTVQTVSDKIIHKSEEISS